MGPYLGIQRKWARSYAFRRQETISDHIACWNEICNWPICDWSPKRTIIWWSMLRKARIIARTAIQWQCSRRRKILLCAGLINSILKMKQLRDVWWYQIENIVFAAAAATAKSKQMRCNLRSELCVCVAWDITENFEWTTCCTWLHQHSQN